MTGESRVVHQEHSEELRRKIFAAIGFQPGPGAWIDLRRISM